MQRDSSVSRILSICMGLYVKIDMHVSLSLELCVNNNYIIEIKMPLCMCIASIMNVCS